MAHYKLVRLCVGAVRSYIPQRGPKTWRPCENSSRTLCSAGVKWRDYYNISLTNLKKQAVIYTKRIWSLVMILADMPEILRF